MDSIKHLPCGICSSSMANVQQIFGLHCGHVFHGNCLSRLSQNRRCITCGVYAPLIYRLFESPEQIEIINNMEENLKKLNKEKETIVKEFKDSKKLQIKFQTDLKTQETKINSLKEENEKLLREKEQMGERIKEYAKDKIKQNKLINEHMNALELLKSENNQKIEDVVKNLKLQHQETINVFKTQLENKNTEMQKLSADIRKLSTNQIKFQTEFKTQETKINSLKEENEKLLREKERMGERNREYAKDKIKQNKLINEQMNALELLKSEYNQKMEDAVKNVTLQHQETINVFKTQLENKNTEMQKLSADIRKLNTNCQRPKQSVATSTENSPQESNLIILNEKLRILNEELNNEIGKNTQLQIDKLRLQAYVDCLKSDI